MTMMMTTTLGFMPQCRNINMPMRVDVDNHIWASSPSRNRAFLMCTKDAEAEAYAARHLSSVLLTARRSIAADRERVALPLPVVTFQASATLLSILVLAGVVAAALDDLCFPARDLTCSASSWNGLAIGCVGAATLRAAEHWQNRVALPGRDRYTHCVLRRSILVGTLPLSLIARFTVADQGVGERAVCVVIKGTRPLPKALLHVAGTTASTACVQGVLQQSLTQNLFTLASASAVRTLSDGYDPLTTWWWPLVASGTALAPVAAAAVAGAVAIGADLLVTPLLQPLGEAEAAAQLEAVAVARQRSPRAFALEAPADVAAKRAAAFDTLATQWEDAQAQAQQRENMGSILRCVIAAVTYAASNGSILGPWISITAAYPEHVVAFLIGDSTL